MQPIGAGADGGIHHATGGVAKLGVEIAVLDLELLYGVRRRNNRGIGTGIVAAIELDVVVDSVEAEVVLPHIHAVD